MNSRESAPPKQTRFTRLQYVAGIILTIAGGTAALLTYSIEIRDKVTYWVNAITPNDSLTNLIETVDAGKNSISQQAVSDYFGKQTYELIKSCNGEDKEGIEEDVRAVRLDQRNALLVMGAYRKGCIVQIGLDSRVPVAYELIGWPEHIFTHEVNYASPARIVEIRNANRWGTGIWGVSSRFYWLDDNKLKSANYPSYLYVAGWGVFDEYMTEFLMTNRLLVQDGILTLRRDGLAYACDLTEQGPEQSSEDIQAEIDKAQNEPESDNVTTDWYTDGPACTEKYYSIKAVRQLGPEIYKYDPVVRQFSQITGRVSNEDLAFTYGDAGNVKGEWFTKPAELPAEPAAKN